MWLAEVDTDDAIVLVLDATDNEATVTVLDRTFEEVEITEFPGLEEAQDWADESWNVSKDDWEELEENPDPLSLRKILEERYGSVA
jgi:hypothetical protein